MEIHYTYIIKRKSDNKKYIGVRTYSSSLTPIEDLKRYRSSSSDYNFVKEQKENPQNFEYEVLKTHPTRYIATLHECVLHNRYEVDTNPEYFNKSKNALGFDATGYVRVRENDYGLKRVKKDDPRLKDGTLKVFSSGMKTIKTESGYKSVPVHESGVGSMIGTVTVKDKDGNNFRVSVNDPRYLSGELVACCTGKVMVKDHDGKNIFIDADDPRYLSGELKGINVGKVAVYDKLEGKNISITKEEFENDKDRYVGIGSYSYFLKHGRYKNKEKKFKKGDSRVSCFNIRTQKREVVSKETYENNPLIYCGMKKELVDVMRNGVIIKTSILDPRIGGEFKLVDESIQERIDDIRLKMNMRDYNFMIEYIKNNEITRSVFTSVYANHGIRVNELKKLKEDLLKEG